MEKENIILKLSIQFAIDIIRFSELLETEKKFIIAKQILKSGTSIGANIHEAQNAESKTDFIHKMKIAAKEMDETEYWLTLCKNAPSYPYDETLMYKLTELKKISTKIITSSKSSPLTH